jgi:two-component system alkaline phosphatase synthesis response regulator PhoP
MTILIIEDERDLAHALRTALSTDGYEVEVAFDGDVAVERARSRHYDLILLDLGIPKKDGYAVCRELRMNGSETPVLILTARSSEAERVLGFELGADDYVVKPCSSNELRLRVRALLRRSRTHTSDAYKFGSIEVDFARAVVYVDGKPTSLSATEYKLLTYFIREQGKILPREHLVKAVWGRFVGDRVVDTCVLHLRSKLERDPQNPVYFVSVRGLGYRFDGNPTH